MKRLFDILVSTILLLVFLIPMFLIAAAIKLDSPGPVIFFSERVGRFGLPFFLIKFRTMYKAAPIVASKNICPRTYVTRLGRLLRKTSLDELPQLLCVLKGEMSLVGPRPIIPQEEDLITLRQQKGVDQILPGVTGWAQINGRDHVTVEEKVELDYEYMQKQSFWFDLKIIFITIWKVLFAHDITH